ncbi:DNA-directed DNA polymerase delta [Sorochytrium milnesiophthora]
MTKAGGDDEVATVVRPRRRSKSEEEARAQAIPTPIIAAAPPAASQHTGPEDYDSFEAALAAMSLRDSAQRTSSRPPLSPFDVTKDALTFQQIEADEHVEDRAVGLKWNWDVQPSFVPTVLFFGVTMEGHSVCCHVHGFLPYFYVEAPNGFHQSHLKHLTSFLNDLMCKQQHCSWGSVVQTELVERTPIMHYRGTPAQAFIKIAVSQPKHVRPLRRLFECGAVRLGGVNKFSVQTYEASVAFPLRLMIDCKISGMSWLQLPATTYRVRDAGRKITGCQLEVDVHYSDLVCHEAVGEWSRMAPLRILSFDIECAGREGVFPVADIDPVIQIANVVTIQGTPPYKREDQPFVRNVFMLGTCDAIAGAQIHTFFDEGELLDRWCRFVNEVDADIITGYNILNFDLPYLLKRARRLRVPRFPYLGRPFLQQAEEQDALTSSRAFGARQSKAVTIGGRIILDLYPVISRDHKLRSYTLNAVSAEFLGERKEAVHHSMITTLHQESDQTRQRLAVYCLKDAYLPQRLLDKLMYVINYSEMARVTGVPFSYLLSRGQQIKVVSQLYRKARDVGVVIPTAKGSRIGVTEDEQSAEAAYEGATVIEPVRGYYDHPIATLDFSSLYPSIMMAHNLCYSTLVLPETVSALQLREGGDFTVTPTQDRFVKAAVRKGLLPSILEDLISARKRAKADLRDETDPFRRAVLDGRQLALKISANSVYGFTGATVGQLPCLEISSSVTAYGREMIERTRQEVETLFTVENGYAHDAKVIYGDTDSVMVNFGVAHRAEAMALGVEAARAITQRFAAPIKLEFEKVYHPYLLINKKRYAGLYWTDAHKWDRMDCKGIETVRRDNCRLVVHVIDMCLRKMLIDRDVNGALSFAKQQIADLLNSRVDMSQLVISKALAKVEYVNKQPHVELAKRMRKRDAGSAPQLGDRVAYVMVKAGKGARAYEKAEDPLYVLNNKIPIDTHYYLENQLSKPLVRIFEPILGAKAERELLHGSHTRSIQVATPVNNAGLMRYAVKHAKCLECKAVVQNGVAMRYAHNASITPPTTT